MPFFVTAALSYLLGSIPFGFILVRIFRGQDVRNTGSGNIGATNVARSSPALGVLTLMLDALKGLAAVALARTLFPGQNLIGWHGCTVRDPRSHVSHLAEISRWQGRRHRAGIFCFAGAESGACHAAIFVVVVLLFRYVSLGSIVAVRIFPLLAWLLHDYGGDLTSAGG